MDQTGRGSLLRVPHNTLYNREYRRNTYVKEAVMDKYALNKELIKIVVLIDALNEEREE